MSVQHCQVCPHCPHCQKQNSHQVEASLVNHGVSPDLSLQEALVSIPYSDAAEETQPTPVDRLPKPKVSIPSLRGLSLLPSRHRITAKDFWLRKFSRPPARPNRPPKEQCPPEQACFAQYEASCQRWTNVPIKLEVPHHAYNSSIVQFGAEDCTQQKLDDRRTLPVHQPSPRNAHHDLAYNLLTGSQASLDHKLVGSDLCQQHIVRKGYADQEVVPGSHSEQAPVLPGLWYSPSYSFSSLPTTASKAALRPSPLRLIKEDDVYDEAPPIPLRSPLRNSSFAEDDPADLDEANTNSNTVSLNRSRPRSSSYTASSVYSSDDDEGTVQQIDTPPSSPPSFPVRSSSLCPLSTKDATEQAEEIREELGIIDDIYSIYTDEAAVKRGRHEALTDDIEDQVAHLSEVSRAPTQKLSRTQRRLAREHARNEAARKLVKPELNTNLQDLNFEQWLASLNPHRASYGGSHIGLPRSSEEHHASLVSPKPASPRRDQKLPEITEEADHDIEATPQSASTSKNTDHIDPGDEHPPVIPASYSQAPHIGNTAADIKSDSILSLNGLRGQLLALMEDDAEVGQQPTVNAARTPSSSSSGQSSTSTEATEEAPLTLQRIVIEWKGQRYPVLIGEGGKIWEEPCTDGTCQAHGKRDQGVSCGMI